MEVTVNKVVWSSKSEEWETPQELFDKLDGEFAFTLDPCCTEENRKCGKYFTKEHDGLSQDWGNETVFCNPPYGRKVGAWVEKCAESHGTTVALLPARTDTKWFHEYIYNKAEIRFIKGRLKFGGSKNSAPFPSMVVIWRKEANHEKAD
jgi:site-specific DNA-methyltransferase (adenine-specific)